MITKAKIEIYKKYKGDGDALCRSNKSKDKDLLKYEDFRMIDDLIQNIKIVENGLASATFKEKLISDLNNEIAPDCINLLKQLAINK